MHSDVQDATGLYTQSDGDLQQPQAHARFPGSGLERNFECKVFPFFCLLIYLLHEAQILGLKIEQFGALECVLQLVVMDRTVLVAASSCAGGLSITALKCS